MTASSTPATILCGAMSWAEPAVDWPATATATTRWTKPTTRSGRPISARPARVAAVWPEGACRNLRQRRWQSCRWLCCLCVAFDDGKTADALGSHGQRRGMMLDRIRANHHVKLARLDHKLVVDIPE